MSDFIEVTICSVLFGAALLLGTRYADKHRETKDSPSDEVEPPTGHTS